MKALALSLALILIVAGQVGCGKKDKDDEKDEKGAIETTVDYVTGYTAVQAKFNAEKKLIQTAIGNAVNSFVVLEGRNPVSLQELVDTDYLSKKLLSDEYGKPLEAEVRDGQLVVRSMRVNKETGRRELNWSKSF